MKTALIFVVFIASLALMHGQDNAKLVTKDFDVKSVFGVNLGDSQDSLSGKTEKPLPNKKEFVVSLDDSGMRLFGVQLWACAALVSKGKIKRLFARFDNSWGEEIGAAFISETFVMALPKKKGEFVADYKNCTVFFGYMKNGDFYAEFWAK